MQWVYCIEARQYNEHTIRLVNIYRDYRDLQNNWERNSGISKLIKKVYGNRNVSIEKVADLVLTQVTNNARFRTTKGNLGNCFYSDCNGTNCIYKCNNGKSIPENMRCGLWKNKKSSEQKIASIIKHSKMKKALLRCREYYIHKGFRLGNHI